MCSQHCREGGQWRAGGARWGGWQACRLSYRAISGADSACPRCRIHCSAPVGYTAPHVFPHPPPSPPRLRRQAEQHVLVLRRTCAEPRQHRGKLQGGAGNEAAQSRAGGRVIIVREGSVGKAPGLWSAASWAAASGAPKHCSALAPAVCRPHGGPRCRCSPLQSGLPVQRAPPLAPNKPEQSCGPWGESRELHGVAAGESVRVRWSTAGQGFTSPGLARVAAGTAWAPPSHKAPTQHTMPMRPPQLSAPTPACIDGGKLFERQLHRGQRAQPLVDVAQDLQHLLLHRGCCTGAQLPNHDW